THSALHNALKQAVRWNLLQKNVAEYVELPKVPHKERRVLSTEESQRFLEKAESMPHGLIFEFALLSGMRPEEFLALQWDDLDFERCTAQVNRALVRHRGTWSFEKPKTAKSRRIITLSEPLIKKLKIHKRQQNEIRLKNGLHWENNNLVFCTDLGTPHSVPNLTYRYYRPILTKAKLPQIRLYDLRHSHATLLLIAEENPKVVAERLGHSTIVLTMDTYSHVIPSMQRSATDKLTKMLYERPKKPVEKRFGTL
ncbi:MAG: site-specific integrase, partial [Pyrinomonadaceae bacterium]